MDYITEKFLIVGKSVFSVKCGESGSISVLVAKIGGEFEEIETNGDIPKNRKSFSICENGTDEIFLIGGINDSIFCMEIYSYKISTKCWSKVTPKDKSFSIMTNICTVTVKSGNECIIYVIGGNLDYKSFNELLIITIKGGMYSTNIIANIQNAHLARIGHSAAVNNNNHVYLFGGIDESGSLHSSLIDIDFSYFIMSPIIKTISRELQYGRFMHVSYFVDNIFYVAGGVNLNRVPLNEALKFDGAFKKASVFQPADALVASRDTLYAIKGNSVYPVEHQPTYNSLDNSINEAINTYKLTPTVLNDKINTDMNAEELFKEAIEHIDKSIEKLESVYVKKPNQLPPDPATFYSEMMDAKLRRNKWRLKELKDSYEVENKLYQEQINALPDVDIDIPEDAMDYQGFEDAVRKMDKDTRLFALIARTSRLTRDQYNADQRLSAIKGRLNKFDTVSKTLDKYKEKYEEKLKEMKETKIDIYNKIAKIKECEIAVSSGNEIAELYKWFNENKSNIDACTAKLKEVEKECKNKEEELNSIVSKYQNISSRVDSLVDASDEDIVNGVADLLCFL